MPQMEHISKTIKRAAYGRRFPCKKCHNEAVVILEDGVLIVNCFSCGDRTRLKEYNLKVEIPEEFKS